MCLNVFVCSDEELIEVSSNSDTEKFWILEIVHEGTLSMVKKRIKADYYYQAGSHMGCACGLVFGENYKEENIENYNKCVSDAQSLMVFLEGNKLKKNLKLFCTSWDEFPDTYETKQFDFSSFNEKEFYLDEDVIQTFN